MVGLIRFLAWKPNTTFDPRRGVQLSSNLGKNSGIRVGGGCLERVTYRGIKVRVETNADLKSDKNLASYCTKSKAKPIKRGDDTCRR